MLKNAMLILALVLSAAPLQADVYRVVGVRGVTYQNTANGATAYRYRGPYGGLHTGYYNPTTGVYGQRAVGPYGRGGGYYVNPTTGNGAAWGRSYRGVYGVRWW